MPSYSQVRTALDEVAGRLVANRNRIQSAKDAVVTAVADLQGVTTQYVAIPPAVDALAAADSALAGLKADKDALLAEVTALEAEATALKTAMGA